jgi:hypothetical protein
MEQKIKAREKFQTPILKEKIQRLWNIKKIGGEGRCKLRWLTFCDHMDFLG